MPAPPEYRQPHLALSTTERHHRLIEQLRISRPRRVRAAELAERLSVGRRTVERDVARLIAVGIPIDSQRGPRGGYRLDVASTIDPVPLTAGEVAALLVSLVAVGPTLSATAQSAAAKLIAALREPPRA